MTKVDTYLGSIKMNTSEEEIKGGFVEVDGEKFYCIENYDKMPWFFMTLVSPYDHWLFISSSGGLSAGRKDENNALFPYDTDDNLAKSFETTGSKSIVRVKKADRVFLWEPFSERLEGVYAISRNLYKSTTGDQIIFEEINHDLESVFNYRWSFSNAFGFVKQSTIKNLSKGQISYDLLDGIQNIMPYGIDSALQNNRSNLVNAYKRNERNEGSSLATFSLSSMIVDRAIPSEALMTTSVWSAGIPVQDYLLSNLQIQAFRNGRAVQTETDVKAQPGAYFIHSQLDIQPNKQAQWLIVAELKQGIEDCKAIQNQIELSISDLFYKVKADIVRGAERLTKLVGSADGLQCTNDQLTTGRHYSNVLFNIMRGGLFEENYDIDVADFETYLNAMNKDVTERSKGFISKLGKTCSLTHMLAVASETKDTDLQRLAYEYLPLTFSRRHGDPSRPWNKFSILTAKSDGTPNRTYQGNWRDIFQNWEALALSYPEFILSMIVKFVNASTIDGYNPYRITRDGVDWEVIEPEDPWSYIGYWGDHQIIYLTRLLEVAFDYDQQAIAKLLDEKSFVYANVPYRIKSYQETYAHPNDTIDFDDDQEKIVHGRILSLGNDGKLVFKESGAILKSSLQEKLLVSFLTKMYNFIPDGGIWLNTQRPEWNDANNALVGNGLSVVTVCHLRRFISVYKKLIEDCSELISLNGALAVLFKGINQTLSKFQKSLSVGFSSADRKTFVDALGSLGEEYRTAVYSGTFGEYVEIEKDELFSMLNLSNDYIEATIKNNRREDQLFHSYNIGNFEKDQISISYLYEMLEGQVAVLNSGLLTPVEGAQLLDALKVSDIYREDQYSYMLYPNRELTGFWEKNTLPTKELKALSLVNQLLAESDHSILSEDTDGELHFNGSFHNAEDLNNALDQVLAKDQFGSHASDRAPLLAVFEQVFNHKAYTGRSGTFFGYEGLGSIYWHMVSKLLLSVQELLSEVDMDKHKTIFGRLVDHYYEIRAGIGINKTPELYGAIPTDPYSHTPMGKGAQQPGMTGQVKEDVINRWAELGVSVQGGCLNFNPTFLNELEFLKGQSAFEYFDIAGEKQVIQLEENSLAFTYCQTPIVYKKRSKRYISIQFSDGSIEQITNNVLEKRVSKEILQRTGKIKSLEIGV